MRHFTQLLFITFCLFLLNLNVLAQEQKEIKWMTWDEAIAQQQQDLAAYNDTSNHDKVPPKKIFMDIYTDWCGWCKKMDASTFKDPAIVEIMNKYYYPVKMDAEMKEPIVFNNHTFVNPDPDGKRSTHQFAASILDYGLSYPSYVMLDENVNRLIIYRGYKQIDDLLGILLFFGKNQHIAYQQTLEKQFEQKAQTK